MPIFHELIGHKDHAIHVHIAVMATNEGYIFKHFMQVFPGGKALLYSCSTAGIDAENENCHHENANYAP